MMVFLMKAWMTGYESGDLVDAASFVLGLRIGMACTVEMESCHHQKSGVPEYKVHVVSPRIFHRIGSA